MALLRDSRLAALLLCLPGCQARETPAIDPSPIGGTAVMLTRFRTDSVPYTQYSGVTAPLTMVIRDDAAWSNFWLALHAITTPTPPLPAVDFTTEMVLVAALGGRPTGGYSIYLSQATENVSGLQVLVMETSPGPDCVLTMATTAPVDLARVPKREGSVEFVTTSRVTSCGS